MNESFDIISPNDLRCYGTYNLTVDSLNNQFTIEVTLNYQNLTSGNYTFQPYVYIYNDSIKDFYPYQDPNGAIIINGNYITLTSGEKLYYGRYSKTFNLQNDGSTFTTINENRKGGEIVLREANMETVENRNIVSFGVISNNMLAKINNTWKNICPWIKINGVWKRCLIWQKINGIWKKGK